MFLEKYIAVVLAFCFVIKSGDGCRKYSCQHIISNNRNARSGEYILRNKHGQRYKAYCEFHCHHGFTFVAKEDVGKLDLDRIPRSNTLVLVRHLRSNGKQFDTVMEQISSHAHVPLSFQYNRNIGYATPVNHATMGPYLYLGFLPSRIARSHSIQGYRANNRDFMFRNGDANPNSYLAFFINPENHDPQGYYKRCCYTALMRDWINVGQKASGILPWNYFFQFEMHMGGGGGYAVNGYKTLTDVVGAALGFRFPIPRTGEQNTTAECL